MGGLVYAENLKKGDKKVNVKIKNEGKTLIAFIEGDIDHHTAKNIREYIDNNVESSNPNLLKIDFSKVQFMDSSGIGLIMGRYRLMQLLKGKLEVINVPENIKKLIKLSGLTSLNIIRDWGSGIIKPVNEMKF